MKNWESDRLITLDLIDEYASELFAAQLVARLSAPLIITLSGDIGVGKTTIIRAMLRSMGVTSAIKSPTFSLVESYYCQDIHFHHFDLYRIHYEEELEYLGFRDYFSDESICCIEWAEHAGNYLPQVDIACTLNIKGSGREMHIRASSATGYEILDGFMGQ